MANFTKEERIRYRPFLETFKRSFVEEEWRYELINYYFRGYEPGSFHSACFENNLVEAVLHIDLGTTWESMMEFMKWLNKWPPTGSWGSETIVHDWLKLSEQERMEILTKHGWVLTDEEVTWQLIKESESDA